VQTLWVGRKVRLRPFRAADYAVLHPLFDDSAMERLGFDVGFPRSLERAQRRLEKEAEQEPDPLDEHWLIIEPLESGQPVGNVGLYDTNPRHRTAMIGISLMDRRAWGHGYAGEAMRLLLRFAFHELDFAKIDLNVYAINARAIALYERLGFQHEGRIRSAIFAAGQRWDDLFMGITRAEYDARHAAWFPDDA
jgi:RimJ/RimL family protein N-acetyltransferase